MRSLHNKSFLTLREETAKNYSQQVVDAILGVREDASLPVFFSVEAGQSSWSPAMSGSLTAVLSPRWNTNRTTLQPNISGSESMSSAIQFNDFGSAPMSRVNTLYAILCFDYSIGEANLPNGVLYTIVSEQNDSSGLSFSRKTKSGTHIGISKGKHEEFLKFSKDVNFWTRHAAPELSDLNSTAGMVYRFSIDYPQTIVELSSALKARDGATAALPAAQQALAAEKTAMAELIKEAKTSKTSPVVLNTLLQFKKEEYQSKAQSFGAVSGQLALAQQTIQSSMTKLDGLINDMHITLAKVKANDPEAAGMDVDGTVAGLKNQVAQIIQGDEELIKQFKAASIGGDLKAEDSMDKLYRDRFESLPERFQGAAQAVE